MSDSECLENSNALHQYTVMIHQMISVESFRMINKMQQHELSIISEIFVRIYSIKTINNDHAHERYESYCVESFFCAGKFSVEVVLHH